MLRHVGEQPHISLQGLIDWDKSASAAAQGVSALVLGGARLAQEREKVRATGELAAFSRTLREIEAETRDEMQLAEPGDWHHAWQVASSPRVAEAVAALPVSLREQAGRMADHYNREAIIRALRDRELERIEQARVQWQQRVDEAVDAGDAEEARQWVEHGRGVFVPEALMEEEQAAVGSRAKLSQWRQRLRRDPIAAVGDYLQNPPTKPSLREQESNQLQQELRMAQSRAKSLFAETLRSRANSGEPTLPDEWQQACRAGIISKSQLASALATPEALSTHDYNEWLRRVDESDLSPEASQNLVLEICASTMPQGMRAELMQRMQQVSATTVEDRLTLSHSLWNLYHAGAFGCPEDEMAARRMQRLLNAGVLMLAEQGGDAVAQWLETLDRRSEQWVCYEPKFA